MNIKKMICGALAIAVALSLASCNVNNNVYLPDNNDENTSGGNTSGGNTSGGNTSGDKPTDDTVKSTVNEYYEQRKVTLAERDVAYVTFEVENYGEIRLALDATAAPRTVRHFLRLVSEGFYDGLSFYSAQDDFVIQGGCPDFDGSGAYKDEADKTVCVDGEFAYNGYNGNDTLHKRGTVSMLWWGTANSASSQFFICNTDLSGADVGIDGYYASIGYVTEGLAVVDKITEDAVKNANMYGFIEKEDQPIIKKATVTDLGGIDIDAEYESLRGQSTPCEYAASRDITGRDVVYAEMTVKNYGKITLLLDKTTAPITVENFVNLVNEEFYDGLTFHRVISNFMIQGGDPKADGTGGNTDSEGNKLNIKGEFSSNGHENDILHKRGVVSMARSKDPDSASSQFFICDADSTHLDGDYAAFGYVISGMDVVDDIVRTTCIFGDSSGGIYNKNDQAVIESIRIVNP